MLLSILMRAFIDVSGKIGVRVFSALEDPGAACLVVQRGDHLRRRQNRALKTTSRTAYSGQGNNT